MGGLGLVVTLVGAVILIIYIKTYKTKWIEIVSRAISLEKSTGEKKDKKAEKVNNKPIPIEKKTEKKVEKEPLKTKSIKKEENNLEPLKKNFTSVLKTTSVEDTNKTTTEQLKEIKTNEEN